MSRILSQIWCAHETYDKFDGDFDIDDQTAMNDALGLCAADFDGDGEVGPLDLAILLGKWGVCP